MKYVQSGKGEKERQEKNTIPRVLSNGGMLVLTLRLHDPLTALANVITVAYSSISTAFCLHYLTFISRRFFSIYSSHLSLGFPVILLPSGLLSYIP